MIKRLLSILLLSAGLLSTLGAREAVPQHIRHYSSADGLSQNTVMTILQDADGFMWFGTWDGLCRFDGHDFKNYKPSVYGSHIAQNRIDYLYEDSLHFIWMSTNDGAFYRLNKHTDRILATDISDSRMGERPAGGSKILESAKGVIWLAGDRELVCIREQSGNRSDDTDRLSFRPEGNIQCLVAGQDDAVWAGTDEGPVQVTGKELRTYTPGTAAADNRITCALRQGLYIWFGTESGVVWRCTLAGEHFERARLNLHSPIREITPLGEHFLLLCTERDGLVTYDTRNGLSRSFTTASGSMVQSNAFLTAYVDREGDVWMINEAPGVLHLSRETDKLERLTFPSDPRYRNLQDYYRIFLEDGKGNLWLNLRGGGFARYDREANRLVAPFEGVTNTLHSAFIDNRGNLWVGSYDSGLDCISEKEKTIRLTDFRKEGDDVAEVRALLQLQGGDILAAGQGGTVRRYSSDGELIHTTQLHSRIYTMLERADGSVLYGTKGDGLLLPAGNRTEKLTHGSDPYSLLSDNIYDLLYGADSTLYVATYGGGVNICRSGRFIHQGNEWTSYPDFGGKVRQLCFLNDTLLWAATTNGLLRINTRTLQTQQTPYFDVRALCKTPDGHMWMGSFGGGLVEVTQPMAEDILLPANSRTYTTRQGLGSDIVLSLVADDKGTVWAIDENTVSYYDRKSQSFQHYSSLASEDKALFGEAAGILTIDGNLLFGCNAGFCTFSAARVHNTAAAPAIRFTDFMVMNEPAEIGGPIKENICFRPEVHLKHAQQVFTIEYSALEYAAPERVHYAYRLDGIDKDWNYVQGERRVTYSQLPAGEYTFHVRSTDADGIWCDNEQTLHLHIKPSFWATPWAFMIYFLILLGLCYAGYLQFSTTNELRQEVAVEQKVTEIKLRFFTNISHELRTPLTLITGPVESILKENDLKPQVRTQLEIVQSNAKRMLRLINQILDFRKLQNDQLKLRVQYTDVAAIAQATFANFTKEAADKRIDFRFVNEMSDPMAWVDKEKADTIVYNLLSNAFKFTPAGRSITLRIRENGEYIILEVQDTGVGIPDDKRPLLFQRFSSHNEINASQEKTGTGIGLNLVKELVDLQHGYIEVHSEVGKGSTFTVMLLRDKEHFGTDANVIISDVTAAPEPNAAADAAAAAEAPEHKKAAEALDDTEEDSRQSILVVDDNTDMRAFLRNILADEYTVYEAGDGEEAFLRAKEHPLDIVVTDLMMPNVDGLELTEHLKTDMSTSHIPVILLTAKSAIESRLQALEYGADDYITKPFSPEYLLARIDNILRQRQRLQEAYRKMMMMPGNANATFAADDAHDTITQAEEKEKPLSPNEIFLRKTYQFMLDNMDNNDLSVDDFVKEMALGRTVFFNKLKGLTGLSPVEYIRDVRIKRAAELLLDGRYNITEVAYMVGMNDSRYFAKCFKNAYGITPTEYRKQHVKEQK